MATESSPAKAKTHQPIPTRYVYFSSQVLIAHHATGDAITSEMTTSFRKSFESNVVIVSTDAPSTFRTPTSLMRFSAMYVASPNRPRQEMKIVNPANKAAKVPMRCSSRNFTA